MILIETSVFTRQILMLLPDDEYRKLQVVLANRPDVGALIRGSGGLRKVRWALPGKGKSGGVRIIYYWAVKQDHLLLLFAFPKTVQGDLSLAQLRVLRRIVKEEYLMKDELFEELVSSVREGGAILRGEKQAARAFTLKGPDLRRLRANSSRPPTRRTAPDAGGAAR